MNVRPTRKVTGAGAGGALGIVLTWLIAVVFSLDVPAEVGAAISTIGSFAGGFVTREA